MSFLTLNSEVLHLRRALQAYVGPNALDEITLSHPISDDDEASFLRLTSWSYVLLFEVGRVSIPYLLDLPSRKGHADKDLLSVRESVRSLRTSCSHNLGLTERDVKLSRRARDWHLEKCGTIFPRHKQEWRSCFESLCSDVSGVVTHCHGVVDNVLASQTDGEGAIGDLRKRLDRNWPTEKFGMLVNEILLRLDQDLNVPVFRDRHLKDWRIYLKDLSETDDVESKMIRLIERDVLYHLDRVLPIDGRDLIELGIPKGPSVGKALRKARELYMLDRNLGRKELLDRISEELPYNNDRQ